MAKGYKVPATWNCKKVKGKKLAMCSPGKTKKSTKKTTKRRRKKTTKRKTRRKK